MNVQAFHSSVHGRFEASSVSSYRLFSFSSPSVRLSRRLSTAAFRRKYSVGCLYGSSLSCGICIPRGRIRSSLTGEVNRVEEQKQQEVRRAYPFHEIEPKWQRYWEENRTFRTPDEIDTSKPKFYVLDMFPYPSGSGLHVGHPLGYTATDILARFKRMQGYNVLHPMGWDAFGLPAEQYAIETGTHPKITTLRNINRFRSQLKSLGFSYDWDREISTIEPDYYKWTQWIFLQLLKRGLAYQAEVPVNWCPALGTVLANEEVVDGVSERGGHPVIRKPMRQWMLKITAYADRLLDDLDGLDWPESIKDMQRNWIGRSEGAEIEFCVLDSNGKDSDLKITVYTTRPDTLFGATYLVVAPEYSLLSSITSPTESKEVEEYKDLASRKSELERTELQKEKTGVFSGCYARNPVNGEAVPIWVADYVLGSYGTGAIMAVPAHDSRDHEFATKYDIPIVMVVVPEDGSLGDSSKAFSGVGIIINSASPTSGLDINGLSSKEAASKVIEWAEKTGNGKKKVNYKLRDWLFARQRYWGEPIPVLFLDDTGESIPLSETELPLTLPELDDFTPTGTGEPPLSKADAWVKATDSKSGKPAKRETSTMPQWAGSCWYYLRFMDPKNSEELVGKMKEMYWGPVDVYVGGAEHAVLHLLYSRFWHKVLYDIGVVSTKEPFKCVINQGIILGEVQYTALKDPDGNLVSADSVDVLSEYDQERIPEEKVMKSGDHFVLKDSPDIRLIARAHKMSKSRGNVVNPDDVVSEYGADSLRLYEMFMGPLRDSKQWNTSGIEGVHRFLGRTWRLIVGPPSADGSFNDGTVASDEEPTLEQLRSLHKCITKVTEEVEGTRFNTGISAMMEFVNVAYKWNRYPRSIVEAFTLLLSPYAPHLAEELWSRLGHSESLAYEPFPKNGDVANFSIYIHSAPGFVFDESTTRSHFFFGRQLENSIQVAWGKSSMIAAERLLLEAALEDPANQRFVLLSDSCVPLYNFSYIYSYLMASPRSFVDSFLDAKEGRYNPKMSPAIPKSKWRKGSQWISLIRSHAEVVVDDDIIFPIFGLFCKRRPPVDASKGSMNIKLQKQHNCIPDEHYVQTLLALNELEGELERRTVTYTLWNQSTTKMENKGWHPITFTYANAGPRQIKEIKGINHVYYETEFRTEWCRNNSTFVPCFLFARKFSQGAAMRLLSEGVVSHFDASALLDKKDQLN